MLSRLLQNATPFRSFALPSSIHPISRLVQSRKMTTIMHPPRDPNTLSNYNNFVTNHTQANCIIDFDDKFVSTLVTLSLRSITEAATNEIILDTSHLEVHHVTVSGRPAEFKLLPELKPFGCALKVLLESPVANGAAVDIEIDCRTTKDCTAIQFMTPAQAKSSQPYMYTQCQAIHARSIFPCQDTPDVKSTFSFNITSPLPVIASGLPTGTKNLDGGRKQYTFEQKIPIPSYLFAIASGDIQTASIGPRSVVATGPDNLAASQWEFKDSTELCECIPLWCSTPNHIPSSNKASKLQSTRVRERCGQYLQGTNSEMRTSPFLLIDFFHKFEVIHFDSITLRLLSSTGQFVKASAGSESHRAKPWSCFLNSCICESDNNHFWSLMILNQASLASDKGHHY